MFAKNLSAAFGQRPAHSGQSLEPSCPRIGSWIGSRPASALPSTESPADWATKGIPSCTSLEPGDVTMTTSQNIDPAVAQLVDPGSGIQREARFFGPGPERMFGVTHLPPGPA